MATCAPDAPERIVMKSVKLRPTHPHMGQEMLQGAAADLMESGVAEMSSYQPLPMISL